MSAPELIAELRKGQDENRILRGLVQTNPDWKCPHGEAVDCIGKCPRGFPGCACGDDRIAILCEDGGRLQAELRELRRDKARLDWLHRISGGNWWKAQVSMPPPNLRNAIDAAMGEREE